MFPRSPALARTIATLIDDSVLVPDRRFELSFTGNALSQLLLRTCNALTTSERELEEVFVNSATRRNVIAPVLIDLQSSSIDFFKVTRNTRP